MKKYARSTLLILFILLEVGVYAQEKKKESYKILRSRSSQINITNLLNEADRLKKSNTSEALDKVQEALAMSIAQGDELSMAKCYLILGEINETIEEWKLAFENYNQALEKVKDSFPFAAEYKKAILGLGNCQLQLGNRSEALSYFSQALTLKLTDEEIGQVQLLISETYYRMGQYAEARQALDNLTQAQLQNPFINARVQSQLAKIYARQFELDKTKDIYQNSLNNLRSGAKPSAQEQESLQSAKEDIAEVLHDQKKYDEEIAIRQQAVDYNLENKNLAEVTKDKIEIGKTLRAKGEETAALKELEEASAHADRLNDPAEQANAYLALAEAYEKNAHKDLALATYKKYSRAIQKNEELTKQRLAERADLIKKQKDIEETSKDVYIGQREETIEQQTLFRQQLTIYGLLLIIVIIAVTSYFIYRNAQASKVANQLLALKSLRSQMNPHFIFNALNSVNHFIAEQDERAANQFLSEFSQLMRLVLENSQEDFIPFYKEQEILSLYLKLEHNRFLDKFDYEIKVAEGVNTDRVEIPPMLIQPYIENAIWHGLRYKESKGKLLVDIRQENNNLVVKIMDDGIGRKRSAELKTVHQKKHNSTGLKNIQERLHIINKVYKVNYLVKISDGENGVGTEVTFEMPMTNRKHT